MPTIKKINVGGVSYDIGGGLTEDVKQASLQIAEKVAYIDKHGQDYYDDLYTAFYDNMWNVTNTLSNASTSNPATKTAKDGTYTAIISANTGYTLDGATVQVAMGGANVTSAVYSNGTISIPAVTGDVVITVVAVALTVVSISAVYTQSSTVYADDPLDDLKTDLVVTATYSDSSTEVVPSTDYTLSGTLEEGTSTITVEYSELVTTFTVTVTSGSRLPDDYKAIEYVQTTANNQYNNLTIGIDDATEVEFRLGIMSTGSQSSTYGYPVACRMSSSENSVGFGINVNKAQTMVSTFGGSLVSISPNGGSSIANTKLDIVAVKTATGASISDGTNSNSGTYDARTVYGNLRIFGVPNTNSSVNDYPFKGRLYYLQVIKDGVLACNLTPCIRLSDNIPGFYDFVNEVFRGDANYTAGPDI